jgi:hypothetical protein
MCPEDLTPEQKRARVYYQLHKDDPEFKAKRRAYRTSLEARKKERERSKIYDSRPERKAKHRERSLQRYKNDPKVRKKALENYHKRKNEPGFPEKERAYRNRHHAKPEVKARLKVTRAAYYADPSKRKKKRELALEYYNKHKHDPGFKENIQRRQKLYRADPETSKKLREYMRLYRADPEFKIRARVQKKVYYHKHKNDPGFKEKLKAYLDRPEVKKKLKESHRLYHARPERKALIRERTKKLRSDYFAVYGWECDCCHEKNPKLLTIAHRSVSRKQELTKDNKRIMLRAIANPDREKYGVQCYNCNIGSHQNGGVCPHDETPEYRANLESKRDTQKSRSLKKERLMYYSIYGWECECCHEKNLKFLTMAHKSISRRQEPVVGSQSMLRLAIRHPDKEKYGVQCYNCNCASAFNGGICPHKGEAAPSSTQ